MKLVSNRELNLENVIMKITKMIKKPKPTVAKYRCSQTNRSFKIPPHEIQYMTLLFLIIKKRMDISTTLQPTPPPNPPPGPSLTLS